MTQSFEICPYRRQIRCQCPNFIVEPETKPITSSNMASAAFISSGSSSAMSENKATWFWCPAQRLGSKSKGLFLWKTNDIDVNLKKVLTNILTDLHFRLEHITPSVIYEGNNCYNTIHRYTLLSSLLTHFNYTVETLHNTVNFCWSTHKRHSIARPKGRGMGCLLWVQRATYSVDLPKLSSIKYLL